MPDLKRWSQRELSRLKQDMDRMFDAFCLDLGLEQDLAKPGSCQATLEETETEIVVHATLPGIAPDDISITVEERGLTIAGSTAERFEGGQRHKAIHRDFVLPCPVKTDQATASFKDGRLTVTLPKSHQGRALLIPITRD